MRSHSLIIAGILVALLVLSGVLFSYQKERWERSYVVGEVYVVGTRRIELHDPAGKIYFAELSPGTRVWSGPRTASLSDVTIGMTLMVVGPSLSAERIRADTIRILTNHTQREPSP